MSVTIIAFNRMKSKNIFPRCKLKIYFEVSPLIKIGVEVNKILFVIKFNSFSLRFLRKHCLHLRSFH